MLNKRGQLGEDIFFTVVIPTRERCDTLIHTVLSTLNQDYDNFLVLVSNNASEDSTMERLALINDSRLKVVNTSHRLSMSENWEFALSHVNEGWVTILGDDDALLPGALRRVNDLIRETNALAIRSNGCQYRWPGFGGSTYGALHLSLERGFEVRKSETMLQQVLDGRRNYNELPMLYNGGFICTDLIKQVKKVSERFFLSMTPDVYSAMVFSLVTEDYVYSYEPLAINGASLHSGGTAGFEKVKEKRLYDPAEKFWREKNIPFHADVPVLPSGRPVRSIPVIIYEAFLQASPFHKGKSVNTSPFKVLKLALESSGPDEDEIVEWAKIFCSYHCLDFKVPEGAPLSGYFKGLSRFFNRVTAARNYVSLRGGPRLPIRTVGEASVVAGVFAEIRPSVLQRYIRHFKNRVGHV